MKKKIFKVIIPILIIAFFVILALLISTKKSTPEREDSAPTVIIQKPVQMDLTESITINGYIEANAMIPVVPFVSGTITEYPAKAGNYVHKDTLLAKIDDAPFRQQMLQAEAAYFAAKSTFDRIETLYKSGSTTQQNYDSAKAQHDASKAQYDLAKLQMDYTEVRSPVNGTILIADSAVGSIGSQTTPIAVIADLSNLVVRLKVPEKYFDLFTLEKNNLTVKITRPAEKGMYDDAVTFASIENIAPYVSPESKNFQVVCKLKEPGNRFRPGMYVKVSINYKTYKNAYTLPIQTKKLDGSVYIYHPETQTVEYIPIEKTPSDSENFIIPEKYEDCWFVIDGQNFVFDGQKVRLFDDVKKEYLE